MTEETPSPAIKERAHNDAVLVLLPRSIVRKLNIAFKHASPLSTHLTLDQYDELKKQCAEADECVLYPVTKTFTRVVTQKKDGFNRGTVLVDSMTVIPGSENRTPDDIRYIDSRLDLYALLRDHPNA